MASTEQGKRRVPPDQRRSAVILTGSGVLQLCALVSLLSNRSSEPDGVLRLLYTVEYGALAVGALATFFLVFLAVRGRLR